MLEYVAQIGEEREGVVGLLQREWKADGRKMAM
jgi:hypothetical protein